MEKKETWQRGEELDSYLFELGRFVHHFAEVETSLRLLLFKLSGLSGQFGAALLSNLKTDGMKSAIKRIFQASGRDSPPVLDDAFAQLSVITTNRNDILHFGAFEKPDGFFVTNHMSAHTPEKRREFLANPDELQKMTSDLSVIRATISYVFWTEHSKQCSDGQDRQTAENWAYIFQRDIQPWRYTRIPPPRKDRKGSANTSN